MSDDTTVVAESGPNKQSAWQRVQQGLAKLSDFDVARWLEVTGTNESTVHATGEDYNDTPQRIVQFDSLRDAITGISHGFGQVSVADAAIRQLLDQLKIFDWAVQGALVLTDADERLCAEMAERIAGVLEVHADYLRNDPFKSMAEGRAEMQARLAKED
jgi:hypothetical protein